MSRFTLILLLAVLSCPLVAKDSRYVIGIHGLLGDATEMRSIERNFAAAGIKVYAWDYPSTEGTICMHGRCLVQLLNEIAACRPGEPIDFITHSVGAIILRQALNIENCPEEAKIGRAVLLAPPNQGSKLARESRGMLPVHWALGSKIGCELMSYDPCTIQAIGPFPETMDVLVIAGCKGNNLLFKEPNDGFVAVSETALETPYYFESFKVRHGALTTNPRVLKSARAFILNGCDNQLKSDSSDEDKEPSEETPTDEKCSPTNPCKTDSDS